MKIHHSFSKIISKIFIILFLLLFLGPFYLVIIYAVKSRNEMNVSRLAFPTTIHWENFTEGIKTSNFGQAAVNSIITTSASVILITTVCVLAAYIISRRRTTFYNCVYFLFVAAMIIPFQAYVIPLYKTLSTAGMINTLLGYILTKSGSQIAFTVLIITGFISEIPRSLEEAAYVDGAGRYTAFGWVIFPMMKPILATSVILNVVNVWNDFQISVVMLQKLKKRTIPLVQFFFMGERQVEANQAFAVFLLSMIPVVVIYLVFQKYIIQGITAGAVKG